MKRLMTDDELIAEFDKAAVGIVKRVDARLREIVKDLTERNAQQMILIAQLRAQNERLLRERGK